jgi:hypothetical protein
MEYEFHPLADLFPMMSDEEIDVLGDDMLANGQRESIAVFDEKILDGRNRYLACMRKGIEPRFINQLPADPVAFVASANLHRRHLDESQRAMIAAKLATLRHGQHKTDASTDASTQGEAANLLNVSRPSVQRARYIQDHGVPALVDAVDRGEVSLSAAVAFVRNKPTVQSALIDKGLLYCRSLAEVVAKANAEVKARADRAAAKEQQQVRQPRFGEFQRTDGVIKSACDFNGEDPEDVAEPGDSDETIRHRIFMHRATEALRHAREIGFEKMSAVEITDDIIAASMQAAEAWSDLTSKLRAMPDVRAAADLADEQSRRVAERRTVTEGVMKTLDLFERDIIDPAEKAVAIIEQFDLGIAESNGPGKFSVARVRRAIEAMALVFAAITAEL